MKLRFINPWWVVVGAVIGLFVGNGPVLGFTFGVFLKPIMADTGWQRGGAALALLLAVILINRLGPCAYPATGMSAPVLSQHRPHPEVGI
jgi:hypothetical protein